MSRAAAVLRAVSCRTFKSLPPPIRKALHGCTVTMGDLGRTAHGRRILGLARNDGNLIVLDRAYLERMAYHQEPIEDLLAHELGHALRARQGVRTSDDAREEVEADKLARAWGFNIVEPTQ